MVKDNPERQRFELQIGDQVAIAVYRREPGLVTFLHTEVPDALRGQGLGSTLARGALELVRQRGDKVVPALLLHRRFHREERGISGAARVNHGRCARAIINRG